MTTTKTISPALADKLFSAPAQPQVHAIIAALLGRKPRTTARYVGKAICTSDGFLQCSFTGGDGRQHHSAFVGSYDDIRDNHLNAIATSLGLGINQRRQIDQLLADWVATDYRA